MKNELFDNTDIELRWTKKTLAHGEAKVMVARTITGKAILGADKGYDVATIFGWRLNLFSSLGHPQRAANRDLMRVYGEMKGAPDG